MVSSVNASYSIHIWYIFQVLFEAVSLSASNTGSVGVDDIKLTPGYCHQSKCVMC